MFKLLSLAAAIVMAAVTFGGPAVAWENIKEMNLQIDQTNFIVSGGCSGTLISIEYRLILTAHHCIKGKIRTVKRNVIGSDGELEEVTFEKRNRVKIEQKDYAKYETVGSISYQTEILAYDKKHDLALLQLVGKNIRSTMAAPVRPVDDEILRGETVFAIGNPMGLDATITSGVVSSTNRKFKVSFRQIDEMNMLQFDAGIAGGSSGGALTDGQGRVIGVVVAGARGTELGFAIPIFDLYPMLDELCMASIYDADADDEACVIERDAEDEEDEDE